MSYSMHLKGNLSGNSFTSENNTLTFSLVANRPSNLKLFINNELFSEVDHKSELHLTHTFTEKGKQYVIKGVASCDNETLCDSLTYFFVDESVQKNYPGGVPKQGVVKNADGSCTFCIAAPNKYSVLLVGSWDDYQITDRSQMFYFDYEGYRYFWTTIEGLDAKKDYVYYYLVDNQYKVADPYSELVLDPYHDKWLSSEILGDSPVYPYDKVEGNTVLSVLRASRNYTWIKNDFVSPEPENLIIYELLLRDFTGTEGKSNANGTIRMAIYKIPYLKSLGVNAL